MTAQTFTLKCMLFILILLFPSLPLSWLLILKYDCLKLQHLLLMHKYFKDKYRKVLFQWSNLNKPSKEIIKRKPWCAGDPSEIIQVFQ